MAKLRPQDADAWPIAEKHRRIFVGWAPWKRGTSRATTDLSTYMLDISELEDGWDRSVLAEGVKSRMIQIHRNLAQEIAEGSIVAVPRPEKGVVHIAPIVRTFELVDSPPWLSEYLELRQNQGLDVEPAHSHAGDVCQTWPTAEWRSVPFPLVPGWIVKTLLSRSQMCRIGDRPDGSQSGLEALFSLYSDGNPSALFENSVTRDSAIDEIKARLQTWLTPRSFEHFCCDLLQVSQPGRFWWPIGGSGDAGTDGIAVDSNGEVAGVLQCKYSFHGDPYALGAEIRDRIRDRWSKENVEITVATLFRDHKTSEEHDSISYLGPTRLAELLLDHWQEVPAAKRLGLGMESLASDDE